MKMLSYCLLPPIILGMFVVWHALILDIFKLYNLSKKKTLNKVENLVAQGKYSDALQLLEISELFFLSYKMPPVQRLKVTKLWVKCQEGLGNVQIAVIELLKLLTIYLYDDNIELWSQNLLDEWIDLYKSCSPTHISKFYLNDDPGEPSLRLGTVALLDYAIKKRGCQPPIGYEEEQSVKDTNLSSKQEKLQPPLFKDMRVGDSVIWVSGIGRILQRYKYHAIVERKSGILEKIRISKQEYAEHTSFYDSSNWKES